jgi:hypothetical protein
MAFDFPASPTEGQVFTPVGGPSYVFNSPVWKAVGQGQIAVVSDTAPANPANGQLWWESDTGILFISYTDANSTQWVQVGGIAAAGAMVQTVITSSGTYTKPQGLQYLEVTVVGGGGGTFPADATVASQSAASGGGGGGGTVIKLYAAADLGATEAYVVGAAGGAGGNGGSSTFKGLTAFGGGAGGVSPGAAGTIALAVGGTAGSASGGDINIVGGPGENGVRAAHGSANTGIAGGGGGTFLAQAVPSVIAGSKLVGTAGRFPGGGATGACNGPSQTQSNGAAGGAGCIIIKEYF